MTPHDWQRRLLLAESAVLRSGVTDDARQLRVQMERAVTQSSRTFGWLAAAGAVWSTSRLFRRSRPPTTPNSVPTQRSRRTWWPAVQVGLLVWDLLRKSKRK